MDKYIIVWASEGTEYQGQGEPVDKESALAWCKRKNEQYPDIRHEIKKVS